MRAGLANGFLRITNRWIVAKNREDRAHADARVEVGTAVKRVEQYAVLSTLISTPKNRRFVILFTREHRNRRARAEASHQRVVGDDIKLLLLLPLHIGLAKLSDRTG